MRKMKENCKYFKDTFVFFVFFVFFENIRKFIGVEKPISDEINVNVISGRTV